MAKGDLKSAIVALMRQQYRNIKEDDLLLGRVVAVYSDPSSPEYGTVDVDPTDGSPTLFSVRVNAVMEGASRGSFTFPKLHSDVVVAKFQKDLDAVVLLFSHVDRIESIVDEEVLTKVQKVVTPDPEDFGKVEEQEEFTHIRQTSSEIELKGDAVKVGSDMAAGFEPMVLGDTLASLVTSLIDILKAATVTTAIGPQPFLPTTITQLEELASRVDTMKSQVCSVQ